MILESYPSCSLTTDRTFMQLFLTQCVKLIGRGVSTVWKVGGQHSHFALAYIGKCDITAKEEVTLHLVASKCLPILLYGLKACHLTKSDVRSVDFMFSRF
jgi:hypothetical protein